MPSKKKKPVPDLPTQGTGKKLSPKEVRAEAQRAVRAQEKRRAKKKLT